MPAKQSKQSPWPASPLVDVPALHGLHRFCPVASRNLPDGHAVQVTCPVVLVYIPKAHLGQYPWPSGPFEVPTAQRAHWSVDCPVALRNMPGSQLVHLEMAWFEAGWNLPP